MVFGEEVIGGVSSVKQKIYRCLSFVLTDEYSDTVKYY